MPIETTTPYTVVLQTADGLTELASAQVIIGPALLKTPEAAAYLGLAAGTLAAWRTEGIGPRYARLGNGAGPSSGTAAKTWTHSSPRT